MLCCRCWIVKWGPIDEFSELWFLLFNRQLITERLWGQLPMRPHMQIVYANHLCKSEWAWRVEPRSLAFLFTFFQCDLYFKSIIIFIFFYIWYFYFCLVLWRCGGQLIVKPNKKLSNIRVNTNAHKTKQKKKAKVNGRERPKLSSREPADKHWR